MGGSTPVDFDLFQGMYGSDPLYHWIGLDSPLMYSAHKAAGGMTSVYRQLGIGCERLFRAILRDELDLTEDQVVWSYEALPTNSRDLKAKKRKLSLDGRVELTDVKNIEAHERIDDWIEAQKKRLDIEVPLKGAVFEVRQGYKSADSKRQNGDLSNASQAIASGYLPVLAVMSTQINEVVEHRYSISNWSVLKGTVGQDDVNRGTFDFLKKVIGYDLPAFFEENTDSLRGRVEAILSNLLEAK
ncbi:hypothetical protein [Corynebacterium variabile]|uniref:hypothetical protein n=1 Tax=Corynebacterium variabile TaxID=1727 RepID=UPI003FD08A74